MAPQAHKKKYRLDEASDFDELLAEATKGVGQDYFLLPIAGGTPVYRERVYCYELYHQLRTIWPESRYSLGGEIDKNGHPLIRGEGLDNLKPDLLVHRPGNMGGNLVIIEVKSVTTDQAGISKDLQTLTAFRGRGEYQRGILLFVGAEDATRLINRCVRIGNDVATGIRLPLLEIWHHSASGEEARRLKIGVPSG